MLDAAGLSARRHQCGRRLPKAQQGAFLIQTLHGIRTVKSLALDARQRHMWDVLVARVAKARFAEGMTGNLIQSVVRPLERLAVSGSLRASASIWRLTSNDPVYIGALFAFLMLSQRVSAPADADGAAHQPIRRGAHRRRRSSPISSISRAEEGRSGHGVRTPLEGHVEFSRVTLQIQGRGRRRR